MSIVDTLYNDISILQNKIKDIQDNCSHPEGAVTKEYGSNTGNYDPSSDCYWTNFVCGLCSKRWQEEGSK